MRRIENAEEISAVLQPNSCCNGTRNTPVPPTAPAVTKAVRKAINIVTRP
jgi:hypothetical protein